MKKIIIIGSPGSGKSIFAKELAAKLNIPMYHLDMIRHDKDANPLSQDIFDEKLDKILHQDSFIIDGNYQRTMEKRISFADTIFLFDIDTDICLQGIKERIGKESVDNPFVSKTLDNEFYEYVKSFKDEYTPEIYKILSKYKDKEIIIFKKREDKYKYL